MLSISVSRIVGSWMHKTEYKKKWTKLQWLQNTLLEKILKSVTYNTNNLSATNNDVNWIHLWVAEDRVQW